MRDVFDSSDITELVGIKPIYLTKYVERKLYGISPSVKAGKGRGKRRLFSRDDLFGIALVWWLFEAGLRSQVIAYILKQFLRSGERDAIRAARKLARTGVRFLVVRRKPRSEGEKDADYPRQSVEVIADSQLARLIRSNSSATIHIIPVGSLFASLNMAVKGL